MKLLIGLGNPGEGYKKNRHNVGHMVIDYIDQYQKAKSKKQKYNSKIKNILTKKTEVFMNDSGEFVKKLVDQYKIKVTDLWVIHDDLDIRLGDYKIQFGKGPKDHGGINDIEEKLGTKDFWRARIGVDNRPSEILTDLTGPHEMLPKSYLIGGEQYVLQNFNNEEIERIDQVIRKVVNDLYERLS